MKTPIKTGWASVKITSEGSVLVSLKAANRPASLYFHDKDQFAEAVRKRLLRVKRWIISVPDQLCITKTLELPAADLDQAYRMLEFELASCLPLPPEELVYGCTLAGRGESLLSVRVYILKRKALENILAEFKSMGIRPARVMVHSVAVESWFGRDQNSVGGRIHLLFSGEKVFISAVTDSTMKLYSQLSLSQDHFQSSREIIADEIHHLAAELFAGNPPVLTIAASDDVYAVVQGWFTGRFSNVEFRQSPQLTPFLSGTPREQDCIFEAVVTQGLIKAVEDPELRFLNLLGSKALSRARRRHLLTNIVATTALAGLVILFLWLNLAVTNWRIEHACREIAQKIAPIQHIAADVESKRQKVKAIQIQLSHRNQIRRLFSQLYRYSPPHISLHQMSYASKVDFAAVNIKGQADTLSHAFRYADAMKESALLHSIQITNAQQIPRPGGSLVEFQAECTMQGPAGI